MSFSRDLLEQIKNRSSLSELASQYTEIKSSGKNLVGLSPFQDEKTPSFYIYDDDTRFKCFSSGKGGSAFDFVMETRGLSFPEAVRYLAEKAGIEIPKDNQPQKSQTDTSKKLLEILRIAVEVYHQNLLDTETGAQAQKYLKARGINSAIAKKFKIGYSPDEWQYLSSQIHFRLEQGSLQTALSREEIDPLLLKVGLIKQKSDSNNTDSSKSEARHYDTFRGRVLFPVFRQDGCPIAFGGRVMAKDSQAPKYINSAESIIYEKRRELYGYSQGLASIRKARRAIVVEGYFDVVSLVKRGITEAVATCGTSLTAEHAALLSRVATHVTIVFDGDRAGRKAAGRCFESFINSGCEVGIVFLDDGEDPDSLAQNLKEEELRNLFAVRERPALDVYLEQSFEEVSGVALNSPDELKFSEPAIRGKLARLLVANLDKVLNPVERDALVSQAALKLDVSERSISELLTHRQQAKRYQKSQRPSSYAQEETLAQRDSDIAEKLSGSVETRQTMIAYVRQIIVSVLCEPSLITHVLDSPAMIEEGLISQPLPAEVLSLLQAIQNSDYQGIEFDLELGTNEQAQIVSSILTENGFKPERFIQEATRQMTIGGHRHKKLVSEIQLTNARFSISDQIKQLRQDESQTKDASELERIAQEKLMKKRSMKKLSSTS